MMRYLKNMEKEIIIDNKLDEIAKIAQFIEELGMSLQLPSEITMSINLAIEEAISNIIRYAYPIGKSGEITLRTNAESNALVLKIIDDGISFDPTSKDTPEILEPLETRLTKGLGLFLIRRTMDIVEYRTIGSENHLILTKKINLNFKPEASMKTNLCQIEGVTILAIEGRLISFIVIGFCYQIFPFSPFSRLKAFCKFLDRTISLFFHHCIILSRLVIIAVFLYLNVLIFFHFSSVFFSLTFFSDLLFFGLFFPVFCFFLILLQYAFQIIRFF